MAQAWMLVFYDISRYLTDKYFDIVWECYPPPPRDPPNRIPKNQFFERLNLGCQFILIRDANVCWALGGDNLQFYPNFALFLTLGGMNLDHHFFQANKLSEEQKK